MILLEVAAFPGPFGAVLYRCRPALNFRMRGEGSCHFQPVTHRAQFRKHSFFVALL